MKKRFTRSFSSWGILSHGPGRKTSTALLFLFCTFLLAFTASAQSEAEGISPTSYRYLRLTVLGGVSHQKVTINEINWLVGADVYPDIRTTSGSTNVTAPETDNSATAWRAYDGITDSPSSVWRPNSPTYPYSIVIDLGTDGAIDPTGIQIGIEATERALASFSIEGSNDNASWTTIYSQSGLAVSDWTANTFKTFEFPDTQAPTVPAGLSASAIRADAFILSWNASTDNRGEVSYEVFAGSESKGITTATSMALTALSCNTTYEMTVKALDPAGNQSAASQPLSVKTLTCITPNLISNGEFNDGTNGWRSIFHSPAEGSLGVDTDADLSGSNAGKLTISNGGAGWQIELFTVLNLEEGKTYDISFKAKAAEGRTAQVTFQRGSNPFNNYWSQTVNLTTTTREFGPFRWTSNITDPVARLNFRAGGSEADVWLDAIVVKEVILTGDNEAPTAPTNLTASKITENGLALSWDASTDNEAVALYEVFAGVTSKGTTTATSMELSDLNCGTNYSFTVLARDVEGNVSEPSDSKSVATSACSVPTDPNTAQLGMNMSSPRPWNSEFIFTNLAHYSMTWMPVETAPAFNVRIPSSELTAERYLQPGATGRLNVFWDLNPAFITTGEYVFTYEGTADVALSTYSSNGFTEVSNEPGRIVINVAAATSNRFLYFDVTSNSETDPIKNIRFTEIDREHVTEIFRPEIVNDYASLKAFRFMDWMKVNNSTISRWEEYPADNALLQTENVSINYMIALANQTGMDAWFCAPLLADDDFLRQLAVRLRDELNPDLRVYIELSNEVWNGSFAATGQAAAKARELGLTDNTNNKQAAGIYYGYRTAQMENLFEEVFGMAATKPALTTVVSWQAVDTWSFENMVIPGYRIVMGSSAAPEAVAIAPYFGGSIGSAANEAEVVTWSSDMILDQLLYNTYGDRITGSSITVAQSINNMATYKTVLDKYNVPEFLAYEGGQHMVAANNNSTLVALLADANRNRKMFDAYMAYFDAWRDLGGDLFATFASTSTYGRSGSWGWKERPSQTREQAPKYDAILTWNSNNPLTTDGTVLRVIAGDEAAAASLRDLRVYPNPVKHGSVTVKFDQPTANSLVIYNSNGKVYVNERIDQESKTIELKGFNPGLYFFKINGVSKKVLIQE
ncbi:hypothetical protein D770_12625 [Flammeovirgaceae bacterium 311]|nr:hypothetical protein D770_12625 [Flammeovirgaceae bacterium 311]